MFDEFNNFKFTETCFMAQNIISFCKSFLYTKIMCVLLLGEVFYNCQLGGFGY